MRSVIVIACITSLAATARAQPAPTPPVRGNDQTTAVATPDMTAPAPIPPAAGAPAPATVVAAEPAVATPPSRTAPPDTDEPPVRPVTKRVVSGFRVGCIYIFNYDVQDPARNNMSLKQQFGLKSPLLFLMGYEGFLRVVSHSWLNVIVVGNASIAGLEQSKIIPSANGLLGLEFDGGFQAGVGINLTPDPVAPSHMIIAAGWTPSVGSIQTPIHFLFIPDASGNSRIGATLGVNW